MTTTISRHSPTRTGGDDEDRRPTAAGDAVEDRTDQRGEHEERGEAEDEEQQDAFAGGVGVDREEQRVGEGDDHRRVAGHHQGVGDRQAAELRVAGQRQRPPAERDRLRPLGHTVDATSEAELAAEPSSARTCSRGRGW